MIEFIQDYVTKALPPETFTVGQQVGDRSPESELYFVRLGVAGFVIDGKLVDQDHQPIVRQTVLVVQTADRRFADTGRAGEVIGLDAPQRATSGPGNEFVFSGQPDSTTLDVVEIEQLRGDLASSRGEFEEYRTGSAGEIERLKGLIDAATDAFHAADTAFSEERGKLTEERDQALADLKESRSQHDGLVLEYQATREQLDTGAARIVELEGLLAATSKPAPKAK
ncbi:hypothetical protein [Sphingomonas sp. Leaf205]|uniref:hypothetical protein n=1 Tax=Sphingomonas sp. Leaf205 TaxID=2876551 RepID=UPI001E3F48DA|nr:hypothetical protein [Sphingomonas sp. Leaf205]